MAIDRLLTGVEQDEGRSLSTRARITASSFTNKYPGGDFHNYPKRLMQSYYDAHLYLANWGTHRVMFRLPRTLIDPEIASDYSMDEQVGARATDEHTVLEFTSEDEEGEPDFDDDGPALLSALVGVRAELTTGDLRPLHLAWLAAYST